jgi:pimeloyl-ACP methyl ester carboxylesterase
MPDLPRRVPLSFEGQPAGLLVAGPPAAPLVLFLAPYPLPAACWVPLLQTCASAGLQAAAVDAPGFGETPARGAPLLMDDLARLALAAADALSASRIHLVGCSMGGYAAMAFARLLPARLASLCLMNTKAAADTAEQRAGREKGAALALAQGAAAVTGPLLPKLVAPGLPARDPALFARIERLAQAATAQGVHDALLGMAARSDAAGWLGKCRAKALVVAGAHDQVTPRGDLEALARLLPGARLEVVAGAGHYAFLEQPAAVHALLLGHFGA